jgi:hypothetical protein
MVARGIGCARMAAIAFSAAIGWNLSQRALDWLIDHAVTKISCLAWLAQ